MNTKNDKTIPAPKKAAEAEELKTEGPLSEKDEVKNAERKMASLNKKSASSKIKK